MENWNIIEREETLSIFFPTNKFIFLTYNLFPAPNQPPTVQTTKEYTTHWA